MVRMNTSPSDYPLKINTIKKAGGNVGPYMTSKYAAFRLLRFMGVTSHSYIIKYMIRNKYQFTLILDGSSDRANNNYILVYFQTQEGSRTVVYLYKLLKLG